MKANRGDVQGMLNIAVLEATKAQRTLYLVPTINGLVVDTRPAPASAYYRIEPTGTAFRVPSFISRMRDGEAEKLVDA